MKRDSVMKLNRQNVRGNVSAASMLRICRAYGAYLELARTLTAMEGSYYKDYYLALLSNRISELNELSLHVLTHRRLPSGYYQLIINVWHGVLDWRDDMLRLPNSRAEHLYKRIYYVDDLLRYAVDALKVNR